MLTNAKEILHVDIFNFLSFPHEGKRPLKKIESVTIYVEDGYYIFSAIHEMLFILVIKMLPLN